MSADAGARRLTIVAALALIGIATAAAVAVLAAKREQRMLGSNSVDEQEFVAVIRRQRICQENELVPGGTAAVRLLIGTYGSPGPELNVRFLSAGSQPRVITEGRLRRGWKQGYVTVPLRSDIDLKTPATVCVHAGGQGKVAIAGVRSDTPAGKAIRLEYLGAGRESYFALLPSIFDRFGRGKSRWLGSWTLVFAALLVVTSLALTARVMAAEGRP